MNKIIYIYLLCLIMAQPGYSQTGNGTYKALFAPIAPQIDGDTSDQVWSNIDSWYTYHQVWLNNVGSEPSADDFSWKFKVAWNEDRFFILAVITDDVLNDRYTDPMNRYYEDDCFEVFFDEDKSGGRHLNSFQAFAYHVSLYYDIVDSDNPVLLNDHADVRMDTVDGKYVWEAAFKVYDKTFTINNPGEPVKLYAGKTMGWALSYCDNDGGTQRDHFFGSEYVAGSDKNLGYINADVFGTVELVNPSVPTFSHVMVDDGLNNPTSMAIAPNGDIYVCEQTGKLKVLQDGVLQPHNLIDIPVNTDGPNYTERGLLGLALDPEFENNHYIYLYYTSSDGFVHNRVSRFTVDGIRDVSGTEVIITELDSLTEAYNHNGGAMHFGIDGKLYVATGENAVPANAQDLSNTHGKLLRINPDGTVPNDNPFYYKEGADPRIWSYGLRNPFTFDISTDGRIFLNDVGYEAWEEIDNATTGGENFGWPFEEGSDISNIYKNPLYSYSHLPAQSYSDSTGCAITGGVFFEPLETNFPQEYLGKYFFMDYCSDWINFINPENGKERQTFAKNMPKYPIAIDHHPDGNLYYMTRGNGTIYKIIYSGEPLPVITRQPSEISVTIGESLAFDVNVSGAEPMTYVWEKDGVIIQEFTGSGIGINNVQYADSGIYTLTVTNAYGTGQSKPVTVKVLEYNAPPQVKIEPLSDTTFYAGQTFTIIGTASDPEDGILGETAFSWSVDLYHGVHIHDGIPVSGKKDLELSIPSAGGHTETDIFYRVTLVVSDSKGLTDTALVDLYPELAEITIQSQPSGLKFTLDGTPYPTPYTFQTVKGVQRILGAYVPQAVGDTLYRFESWSHSVDMVNIIEPLQNMSYTVNYERIPMVDKLIKVKEDAYISIGPSDESQHTTAFGAVDPDSLKVAYGEGISRSEIYLKFDLGDLNIETGQLFAAGLQMFGYVAEQSLTGTATIQLYEANAQAWGEDSITWMTSPGYQGTLLAEVQVGPGNGELYEWELTDLLQSYLEQGDSIMSLVLVASENGTNSVVFHSKESETFIPSLMLRYESVTGFISLEEKFIRVYPNPFSGAISINVPMDGAITIMDISGKVILNNRQVKTGENILNPDIEPGVYQLLFECQKGMENIRLIRK